MEPTASTSTSTGTEGYKVVGTSTSTKSKRDSLDVLMGRIPATRPTTPNLRCCCGRTDCVFLKHNCAALDDLEKQVQTTAQLGQALLLRHEQYMHDAELDRLGLCARIEQLEADKRELEDHNAQTIKENQTLQDELEGLNGSLSESDAHIKSLEATLSSAQQEVRRLEHLAAKTHDLESQLASIEQEQGLLQRTLETGRENERCTVERWRVAERKLLDVNDQLEKIEREAWEERERHANIVERMHRQRAVERELDTAAGRLKGAAASMVGTGKGHVVSHFVKDILQDNANLQMGIVELRELLMNSNDEVQQLREQLLMHQPINDELSDGQSTLRAELAPKELEEAQAQEAPNQQVISQALHIHHHYHGSKKEESRRPKKKRVSLNPALFTPTRRLQSPTTPRNQETANTILSQTSVSIPSPMTPNHRWSMQSGPSDFAPSSVPSSPNSMYRHSGMFDRGFDVDSSRPTSPTSSVEATSPQFQPYHYRKRSEISTRSFATPMGVQGHVIHEEEDGDIEEILDLQETPSTESTSTEEDIVLSNTLDIGSEDWSPTFTRSLRRSTSHESILSISGIDIHTLLSRPSQRVISTGNPLFRSKSRLGAPYTHASMETITSASAVTARPTLTHQNSRDSSTYLRSAMRSKKDNSDTRSVSSSGSGTTEGGRSNPSTGLGGWVFGRWGRSPSPAAVGPARDYFSSVPQKRANSQNRAVSTPTGVTDPLRAFMGRDPGINQKGPVPGFLRKTERAPSQVRPRTGTVDHDALKEVLEE